MAWLDDRFWAHPKVVGLPDKSFRVCVNAILYSHGFGLYGHLEPVHLKAIGATPAIRNTLENAGLWEPEGDGIFIHDWDEHNGKRDAALEARRQSDRERKRREREETKRRRQAEKAQVSARTSRGQSRDSHADSPADVTPPVTGRSSRARAGAGPMTSDRVTSDASTRTAPEPEPEVRPQAPPNGAGAGGGDLQRLDPDAALAAVIKEGT